MEESAVHIADIMCPACGRLVDAVEPGESPTTCSHCGVSLAMAPAEVITDGTISIGFIGSGRGSRSGIAVTDPNGSTTLFTEDGIVRRVAGRQRKHFSNMKGLTSMSSRVGAALVTLEHLPIPSLATATATRTALLTNLVAGDHAMARRAAADLSAAGVAGPIAQLPLSAAEIHWWSALAELRVQRFDGAVSHLAELPLGAYPTAVGLLVLCTGAPIAAVSRRARNVLESRLSAVDAASPLAGAATIAGRRSPLIDWLVDPEPFEAIVDLPIEFPSVALDVLRALAGRHDPDEPVTLPASAKPGVMDDLIDRGHRIDDVSLRALDHERRVYLAARTDPETLSDDDVDDLDFEEEHDRRLLQAGRIPDPTPEHPDTPLIAAIRDLVTNHRSSEALRDRVGPMGDALAAFLAAPSAEGLVPAITDDESLWVLLERSISDAAIAWDAPEGTSARRFLTWFVLRLTQRRLYSGDVHGALDSARHAVRLADAGAARVEALNMSACTNWLLGLDQSARELLVEASEAGGPDDVLDDHLDIIRRTGEGLPRRHPHVILGLPTGSERTAAERAFATRSRIARRDPEFPYTVDDLIWALNQVESAIDEPHRAAPVFQLPIDPRVLQVPTGPGLLRPAPQPLGRRTPPTSDAELQALIAEARSDALLHVLKGAGAASRQVLGSGREGPPPRPVTLSDYPRQRTSRLPQYLIGLVVVAAGIAAAVIVMQRKQGDDEPKQVIATTSTSPATIATVAPTTEATTTTEAPIPGLGDGIEVNNATITPHDPVTVLDHLCLVFDIEGDGLLGFVPTALSVRYGARVAEPALEIHSDRGLTSDVVFGETVVDGPIQREVCFLAPKWDANVTDLLYETDDGDVEWRIWNPAG